MDCYPVKGGQRSCDDSSALNLDTWNSGIGIEVAICSSLVRLESRRSSSLHRRRRVLGISASDALLTPTGFCAFHREVFATP